MRALATLTLALCLSSLVHAAPSKTESVLRQTLDVLAIDPSPAAMTDKAARRLQGELNLYLRDTLVSLGKLKSIYGMGAADVTPPFVYNGKPQKLELFQATYQRGWIQWRLFVGPGGKIEYLVPFAINAPGVD